jgi:hypothetical protein
MTGPSHYVGGVEPAIAELQEPLGVNAERSPLVISFEGVRGLRALSAYSDKGTLSGSITHNSVLIQSARSYCTFDAGGTLIAEVQDTRPDGQGNRGPVHRHRKLCRALLVRKGASS